MKDDTARLSWQPVDFKGHTENKIMLYRANRRLNWPEHGKYGDNEDVSGVR